MVLLIFCVRDRATDQFANPMFLVSTGQAVRMFADQINDGKADNPLFKHAGDFDLYTLGSWDSDTGEFKSVAPKQVAIGKDLIIKQ